MNESPIPMGLRLPPGVRKRVEDTAALERRSLNSQITVLIERGLRAPETRAATDESLKRGEVA